MGPPSTPIHSRHRACSHAFAPFQSIPSMSGSGVRVSRDSNCIRFRCFESTVAPSPKHCLASPCPPQCCGTAAPAALSRRRSSAAPPGVHVHDGVQYLSAEEDIEEEDVEEEEEEEKGGGKRSSVRRCQATLSRKGEYFSANISLD